MVLYVFSLQKTKAVQNIRFLYKTVRFFVQINQIFGFRCANPPKKNIARKGKPPYGGGGGCGQLKIEN